MDTYNWELLVYSYQPMFLRDIILAKFFGRKGNTQLPLSSLSPKGWLVLEIKVHSIGFLHTFLYRNTGSAPQGLL